MGTGDKYQRYQELYDRIEHLIGDETDEVAVMATVVCELHHGLEYFDWTGFYRVTRPGVLKVGPYQGSHGCLTIPFTRGVCGAAARTCQTQIVNDVRQVPYHIACSETTRSEIVVPVLDRHGMVRAVLDVDSNQLAAFDATDKEWLERIASLVARRVGWQEDV